jgi:hypothetical protein
MNNLYRKIIPLTKRIIYIWYEYDHEDITDISRIQIFSYGEDDIINDMLIDISNDDINFQQYLTSLILLKTDGVV